MTAYTDAYIEGVIEQLESAKREIGALHLLLAAVIGEGNTARIPDTTLHGGQGRALKMSRDEKTSEFLIAVTDMPSDNPESVVE